jgi:hypothetical protein
MFDNKVISLSKKTQGTLIIKEYPTASAHSGHFKALLNELALKKSFKPDIIFIDYLNICASSRYRAGSNVNSYSFIKAIAEELRGLAVENKLPIVSATQTTRAGYSSTDVGLEDTSESFGLPATADLMFAIISTEQMTDKINYMTNDKYLFNNQINKLDNSKIILKDTIDNIDKNISDLNIILEAKITDFKQASKEKVKTLDKYEKFKSISHKKLTDMQQNLNNKEFETILKNNYLLEKHNKYAEDVQNEIKIWKKIIVNHNELREKEMSETHLMNNIKINGNNKQYYEEEKYLNYNFKYSPNEIKILKKIQDVHIIEKDLLENELKLFIDENDDADKNILTLNTEIQNEKNTI